MIVIQVLKAIKLGFKHQVFQVKFGLTRGTESFTSLQDNSRCSQGIAQDPFPHFSSTGSFQESSSEQAQHSEGFQLKEALAHEGSLATTDSSVKLTSPT